MSKILPKSWQLQDAKNRLSEVVDDACRDGAQVITRRGVETAVVISFRDWTRLARPPSPLIEVLRRAPRISRGLDVQRSADTGRDIDL